MSVFLLIMNIIKIEGGGGDKSPISPSLDQPLIIDHVTEVDTLNEGKPLNNFTLYTKKTTKKKTKKKTTFYKAQKAGSQVCLVHCVVLLEIHISL